MEADRVGEARGWGLTVLRIIVGMVFLVHGIQKVFVFGVSGFAGNLEGMGAPLPLFFSTVVTLVELLGGAALILGLFTRLVVIPLAIDMLVAILTVHLPNGFFTSSNGYEFPLVLLAACVALMLGGSGEASLDRVLAARGNPMLARLTR
jgi:putative oxidoreductase